VPSHGLPNLRTGQSDAQWTVLRLAAEEDVPWREEAIHNLFEEVFVEGSSADEGAPKSGNMSTPEKIALALRAQRLWPGREQEWRKLWAPTN